MAYPIQTFPPPNSGQWSTGLCGCFEDIKICFLGHWCTCILIGRYVEILSEGTTSSGTGCCLYCCLQYHTGCGFAYTCLYRGRLRRKFGLPAKPCGDCLTDYCCLMCSVCQVYRELNNRGINPALGYEGVRHVYNQPPQAPPQQQYMGRSVGDGVMTLNPFHRDIQTNNTSTLDPFDPT